MLVITRKPKESLLLREDICITILDIRSDQVKIGVDAPPEVRVVRGELLGEISQRNRSAARLFPERLEGIKWGPSAPAQFNPPRVYLETEALDLDLLCSTYLKKGFLVRQRQADEAWLEYVGEKSGMWLHGKQSPHPDPQLRLQFD